MSNWSKKLTIIRDELSDLYPDRDGGLMLVDMAGISSSTIDFSGGAKSMWHKILKEASKRKKVSNIVELALADYPDNNVLKINYTQIEEIEPLTSVSNFKAELHSQYLKAQAVESKKIDSSLGFSSRYRDLNLIGTRLKEDSPNVNILVPNKKGLEKAIGSEDIMDLMVWFGKMEKSSMAVCKIETSSGETGTGFILNGGYLITNNHVIASREEADKSRVIMNYMIDENKNVLEDVKYNLDSADFISSEEEKLDYTIVKIQDDVNKPISKWGYVELENFFTPKIFDKVSIIQHPDGNYKKVSLPDNVIGIWKQYLFYITDTKEGSSGSPVFNKDWRVVALHHAGNVDNDGFQINETGDKKPSNRGILIESILEDLKEQNYKHNFLSN